MRETKFKMSCILLFGWRNEYKQNNYSLIDRDDISEKEKEKKKKPNRTEQISDFSIGQVIYMCHEEAKSFTFWESAKGKPQNTNTSG